MLRVFEAFSGIGTQRMALRRLGIEHEVVGISEIDPSALTVYEAIHGETQNFGDITTLNPEELPDFDLFTYSFPCQDLSAAGRQQGLVKGSRSGLLYECEKLIEVKRPKYLLLENVKHLISKKFKPAFDEWLNYLEGLGYTNYWQVLNAKHYGVPQHRERVFVVSILGTHEPFTFPTPIPLHQSVKDLLEEEVGEHLYIHSPIRLSSDYDCLTIENHPLPTLSSERRTQLCFVGGLGKRDWARDGKCYSRNFPQGSRVYDSRGIACTQTAQGGGIGSYTGLYLIQTTPQKVIRRLSVQECWRLMGISDEDFNRAKETGISNRQLYKQAGNSIVVPVLEAIFKQLFNC